MKPPDGPNAVNRRDFLEKGMWGALLFYASLSSLNIVANTAGAETVVPKQLVLNPHWWKLVYAAMAMLFEIPYLEAAREASESDAEVFRHIAGLGSELNWGTRVVPVRQAIHPETEILPYQEFEELLMRTEVRGVGECWCRSTFKNCDRPTNTCIYLAFPGNRLNLIDRGHVARVTREEIREVIERAEDAGLVHELIRVGDDDTYYVICNCCPCCCAGLRGLVEFGNRMVTKSEFIPEINEYCNACGACLDRCHFSARTIEDGRARVDPEKCFGCGLCCTGCPKDATFLVERA